jgi:hypothetical protein
MNIICPYKNTSGDEVNIMDMSLRLFVKEDYKLTFIGDDPAIGDHVDVFPVNNKRNQQKELIVARNLFTYLKDQTFEQGILTNDDIFAVRNVSLKNLPLYHCGLIKDRLHRYGNSQYKKTLENSIKQGAHTMYAVHYPMPFYRVQFVNLLEEIIAEGIQTSFRNLYGSKYSYLHNAVQTQDCKIFSPRNFDLFYTIYDTGTNWISVGDRWYYARQNQKALFDWYKMQRKLNQK